MSETEDPSRSASVGERIVQSRREMGMKQAELAELLNVSERTMQAYEAGEVVPYRRLKELERVLRKPMAWFLHGENAVENLTATQIEDLQQEIHTGMAGVLARLDDILVELKKISSATAA